MQIVNSVITGQWSNDSIDVKIIQYVNAATEPTDIVSIASGTGYTYAQVAWALGVHSSGKRFQITALPTNDSEIPVTIQMNSMWT